MMVFRIEDSAGFGAYSSGCYFHPRDSSGRQPLPIEDSELLSHWKRLSDRGLYRQYKFGFESIHQLKHWFYDKEWRLAAHAEGLRVVAYSINPVLSNPNDSQFITVYRGSKQLIFWHRLSRYVRNIPLSVI